MYGAMIRSLNTSLNLIHVSLCVDLVNGIRAPCLNGSVVCMYVLHIAPLCDWIYTHRGGNRAPPLLVVSQLNT